MKLYQTLQMCKAVPNFRNSLVLLAATLLSFSCATHTVKSTSYTPVVQDSDYVSEEFLLDVGVQLFDPGLDEIRRRDEDTTNPEVRIAEARYAPYLLADTLQRSGNWGIVRLMPNENSPMDVNLAGTVLQSDGETMHLRITVTDSSGRQWYTKNYEEAVSQFSYEPAQRQQNDPFQVVYNKIANDLLAWRKENLDNTAVTELRMISEIQFARRFALDAFDDYLVTNRRGQLQLSSFPADNDPLLSRIRNIRERDFMYIDTVQDYYANYTRQMRTPYDSWREQSYHETQEIRELEASARRRFIAGAAAVVGGVAAAANGGNYGTQVGGAAAAGAGAYLIRSGFEKRNEAQIHVETLEELSRSLEDEVTPQVLTLDDRTITLTGNVEEQYGQWREILADMYAAELNGL